METARDVRALACSYFSEDRLIQNHDTAALWYKYRYGEGRGLVTRLQQELPYALPEALYRRSFNTSKRIGALYLCHDEVSPVAVQCDEREISVGSDAPLTMHVQDTKNPLALRQDLARAADYIAQTRRFRRKEFILGVTYKELTRVAVRAGFRPTRIIGIDPDYLARLEVSHKAFLRVNKRSLCALEPRAVYLPTQEFITRFGTGQPARKKH